MAQRRVEHENTKEERLMKTKADPTDFIRPYVHRDVVSIAAGASLREVSETLSTAEVGALVVYDGGVVAGTISERDVVRALGDGADPDTVWAADVMTDEPICADPDDAIIVVAERMLQAGVRHLPVLGGGQPIGMVSAKDLLEAFIDTFRP